MGRNVFAHAGICVWTQEISQAACVCVCVAQGVCESNRMAVTDLPQKRQPASFYGEQIDLG